jgi:signal peptidase II
MARRYKLFAVIGLITLILDQLSKWYARDAWVLGRSVKFLGSFWEWRLSYNTGAAFGMFNDSTYSRVGLSLVGLVAFVAIVLILRKAKDNQTWMATALALVAGGAIGNVVDRILAGKVTDFVVWKYGKHEWPAFNIADVALVVGVLIMFLDVGREQKRAREEAASEGAKK